MFCRSNSRAESIALVTYCHTSLLCRGTSIAAAESVRRCGSKHRDLCSPQPLDEIRTRFWRRKMTRHCRPTNAMYRNHLLPLLILSLSRTTSSFASIRPSLRPLKQRRVFESSRLSFHPLDTSVWLKASGKPADGIAATATAPLRSPRPTTSTLPDRSALRRKGKRKQKKRRRGEARGQSLTEYDLAEHVSNLYIHGPGGVLRKSVSSSRRLSSVDTKTDTGEEAKAIQRKLDRHPVLVLNADYQPLSHLPLSIWSWQDAIKAVFSGKVTVVDVYPDVTIRAATLEIPLPAVIALNEYVHRHEQTPAFTKRNVFLRDEYRCQYCNDRFRTSDLSLDHVVPRCRGGRLNWKNTVTCCRTCNGRKGCLDVGELHHVGMRLLRPPSVPSSYELASIAGRMLPRRVDPTWEPYLGLSGFEASASSSS